MFKKDDLQSRLRIFLTACRLRATIKILVIFSVPIDVTNLCGKYLYKQIRHFGEQCAVRHWNNKTMKTKEESHYYTGLELKTKLRYKEKIDLISNCDPYTIKKDEMMTEIENFPSISYPDIVNYFLFALSPLTKEELKAYKGLESYNQFVSGWVKEVLMKEF